MGKLLDVLEFINQTTIDTAISTVETAFGIEYDKSKHEAKEDQFHEIIFMCPFERDECEACGECELEDGEY